VIMLANAKYISDGGVAYVYIVNIVPGLLVQITAPYWFDLVTYHTRLSLASTSMTLSFLTVAYFSHESGIYSSNIVLSGQLLGVALISFQCGLGEASLLALAGKWDRQHQQNIHVPNQEKPSNGYYLSAFAMGTGIAGPLGYLWKIALNEWVGVSVTTSLLIAAIVLSLSYGITCTKLATWSIDADNRYTAVRTESEMETNETDVTIDDNNDEVRDTYHNIPSREPRTDSDESNAGLIRDDANDDDTNSPNTLPVLADLSAMGRFRLQIALCWPYMIPLFMVYAAEYACQAGAWTSIGFPVTSIESRTKFYEQSNWLYQAGVFVSRSTGSLFTINMIGLWILPAIQVMNLVIFSVTANSGVQVPHGILYHKETLLSLSFFTGLLGGAVYVHGYNRIVTDVPKQYTEFAVSSTSVAVSLGVLVADIMGLFLQSCLYQSNHLDGAVVQCPF
jgi:battenin